MGKQVVAGLKKGLQLSRLERTPDKREVGGSSPLKPIREPKQRHKRLWKREGTLELKKISCLYLENRIPNQRINQTMRDMEGGKKWKPEIFHGDRDKTSKSNKQARGDALLRQVVYHNKLSEEERREDALALRADERRDKLRKAMGSCK